MTGACLCPPGIMGDNCEDGCPPGIPRFISSSGFFSATNVKNVCAYNDNNDNSSDNSNDNNTTVFPEL